MDTLKIDVSLLYFIMVLFCQSGLIYSMNGPPTIVRKYDSDYTIRVGENLQLRCPLHSQPTPLFKWSKNGEIITYGWEKIRLRDEVLSIKSVEKIDSGEYECEATNGFGTNKVEFSVCVLGNDSSNDSGAGHCSVSPAFLDGNSALNTLEPSVGDSLQLSCAVRGKPRPEIEWKKDGHVIPNRNVDKFILSFSQISRLDQGRYTCHVSNAAGSVDRTFNLKVKDTASAEDVKPWFFPSVMKNETVRLGETARFSCKVYSRDEKTQIRWIKKSVPWMNVHNMTSLNPRDILQEGVQTDRVVDTIVSTLTIYPVTAEHVGAYVCCAVNLLDIQYQEVWLRITPDPHIRSPDDASAQYLPVVVAVGSVTGIILLALVIWFTSRRCAAASSSKRTPSSTASTTSSPHNSGCTTTIPQKNQFNGGVSTPRAYPGYGPVPSGVEHPDLMQGYMPQMAPQPPMPYSLHQQHLIQQQQRLLQQSNLPHDNVQYQLYEQC